MPARVVSYTVAGDVEPQATLGQVDVDAGRYGGELDPPRRDPGRAAVRAKRELDQVPRRAAAPVDLARPHPEQGRELVLVDDVEPGQDRAARQLAGRERLTRDGDDRTPLAAHAPGRLRPGSRRRRSPSPRQPRSRPRPPARPEVTKWSPNGDKVLITTCASRRLTYRETRGDTRTSGAQPPGRQGARSRPAPRHSVRGRAHPLRRLPCRAGREAAPPRSRLAAGRPQAWSGVAMRRRRRVPSPPCSCRHVPRR